MIPDLTFSECPNLADVYCYAKEPFKIQGTAIKTYDKLHVLTRCEASYANQYLWKYFTITEDLENSCTNEDGIISVAAHPVLITTEGSTIRVKGLVNTKEVHYATTDGKLLGTSSVIDGESLFDTHMPAGTIVIVCTDGGSAKTMLR